jgi:hypothetical protein
MKFTYFREYCGLSQIIGDRRSSWPVTCSVKAWLAGCSIHFWRSGSWFTDVLESTTWPPMLNEGIQNNEKIDLERCRSTFPALIRGQR